MKDLPTFTRKEKNIGLITVNVLAFFIQFYKIQILGVEYSRSLSFWFYLVPFIILINLFPSNHQQWNTFRHVLLFLATGTFIGNTIAQWSSNLIIEWIWLALALLAAIIHYSKSDEDIYLK